MKMAEARIDYKEKELTIVVWADRKGSYKSTASWDGRQVPRAGYFKKKTIKLKLKIYIRKHG